MPRRSPPTAATRPPRRRGATVLLALLALLLAGLVPGATAGAAAAVTTLQPDSDVTGGWQVKPDSAGSAFDALDDGLTPPTAVPATDYLWAGAAGRVTEVGLSSPMLGPDDTVTGGQAWFYANTGATTQLRVEAVWGGVVHAGVTVAAGQGFAWRSLAIPPADAENLRLRFTALGGGDTNIRAAYATITPVTLVRTLTWEDTRQQVLPTPPPYWKAQYCTTCSWAAAVSGSPTRGGGHSARFELRKDDVNPTGSKRAELAEKDAEPDHSERWYGFSIYLPAAYWASDPSAEALTQWHQSSPNGSPPLEIDTLAGNWQIARNGNPVPLIAVPQGHAYATDRWTDWVVHVKWSGGTDGLVEVWRDGALVYSQSGTATKPADGLGVYMKFGVYKWGWAGNGPAPKESLKARAVYDDELRIGDQSASYAAVVPR